MRTTPSWGSQPRAARLTSCCSIRRDLASSGSSLRSSSMNRSASSRRMNVSRPNGQLGLVAGRSTEYRITGCLLGSKARRITASHDGAFGLATGGISCLLSDSHGCARRAPAHRGRARSETRTSARADQGFPRCCVNDDDGTIKESIGGDRHDSVARDTFARGWHQLARVARAGARRFGAGLHPRRL